ncbi:MAG: YadA-like family protein [Thiothrix sp.]|nr:YadA-like family protein [Thiothrix sp.]
MASFKTGQRVWVSGLALMTLSGLALAYEAGDGATADVGATALGEGSAASGIYSVAVGTDSNASGVYATALGADAVADGFGSVALGSNATTGGLAYVVSVGDTATGLTRGLVNVTAGAVAEDSLDAVNGGQLWLTDQAVAANAAALAGQQALITAAQTAADSAHELATAVQAGVEQNADAIAAMSELIGGDVTGVITDATALAQQGVDAAAAAQDTADQALALGQNSVQYTADGTGVVLNGNAGLGTDLQNVAAGSVAEGSLDAVNGGQLWLTDQAVATNATAMAEQQGLITAAQTAAASAHDLATTAQAGVEQNAAAILGLDGRVTTAQTAADQALALGQNSVQYDADGGVTLQADDAGTPLGGIRNVAAGVSPYDAVNLGQMQAADAATLTRAKEYAAKGIAAAMAMPGVSLDDCDDQGVNVALGHYDGQTALGVAYAQRIGNPFFAKSGRIDLGASYAGSGSVAARAGWNFSW